MTKVNFKMRKVVAIAICLAGVVMFASCGGGGKKPNSGSEQDLKEIVNESLKESAKQSEVTDANWQQVVKEQFGINVAVPDGWTYNTVRGMIVEGDCSSILLYFDSPSDNAATDMDIARALFAAAKAVSTKGVFKLGSDFQSIGTTYETFDELKSTGIWYYVFSGYDGVIGVNVDHGQMMKINVSKNAIKLK